MAIKELLKYIAVFALLYIQFISVKGVLRISGKCKELSDAMKQYVENKKAEQQQRDINEKAEVESCSSCDA